MRNAKRLTALALSGVLSLSLLAGCANTPSVSTPNPTPSPSQTARTEVPDGALVLADQGIFSAGGITTTTSEGVFDPEDQ